MTILVQITQTARAMGRNQDWFRYGNKTHRFDNTADALEWIKEHYEGRTRRPIYADTKSRGTIQCGWIYSGRDEGNYTQDWVSLDEVVSETERTAQSIDVRTLRRKSA